MRADGYNGQIEVDENNVYIERAGRRGFLDHGRKGRKQIPIASITSIQFKEARGATRAWDAGRGGYIQFGVLGGVESRGGAIAAYTDENTVVFSGAQQQAFEAIRDYITARIDARQQQVPQSQAPMSVAGELEKLGELRAKGLISDEEFAAAKARLLGS
jgi:hypothetical protein